MAEQNKGIKISDLPQSVTFTGLWTLGYQVVDGMAVSVKVSLDEIQAAYEDVKSATADARQSVTDGEALRIDLLAAESMRAVSESERQSAEIGRAAAEAERESDENERKANEADRKASEIARSSAEEARKEAEAVHDTAEKVRRMSESAREAAESDRQAAERARDNAERERSSAESEREKGEQDRITAELEREAAESVRQRRETERQTASAEAVQRANVATEEANESADNANKAAFNAKVATDLSEELNAHPMIIQDGFWWRWDTENDVYENTGLQAKGDMGASFKIIGQYATEEELIASVPDGSAIDGVFAVGAEEPFDYYAWVVKDARYQWVNQGSLKGPQGLSAYEVWLREEGNAGKSISEYLAYLQRPATEAAAIADRATADAIEATRVTTETSAEIRTSEELREQAERSREESEADRMAAEEARESAETERQSQESHRSDSEDIRKEAEEDRQESESQRRASETARAAAETERATAETDRTASETERKAKEAARVATEEERVEADRQREANEADRMANEAIREANENDRIAEETRRGASENERQQAEAERKANEDTRQQAEADRATSESERSDNESARIESERLRVIAEESRANAESARADEEAKRADAETLRRMAESNREAAEAGRESNESDRQQAEHDRMAEETKRADAESVRTESEATREANEQTRAATESARVENEIAREAAELTRKANEDKRKQAESSRQAAEDARDQAESDRGEAEDLRQTNEDARIAAELTRKANENARQSQESQRSDAESARQLQEAERQTNTTTAIANAEIATASANTAAQNAIKAKEDTEAATALATELNNHPWTIQGGVWYKWNTETDQYESTGLQAKGDKGEQGIQGIQGIQGEKGEKGEPGKDGADGETPVFETGTITTGEPGTEASATVEPAGTTADGRPLYRISMAIPRGQQGLPGEGSGNVSASGDGLLIGKRYLFVPGSDGSTAGTFVEYTDPDIPSKTSELENDSGFTTESAVAGLLSGYVQKVSGKGLSTEDFTTDLKEKLSILSNYDDASIQQAVASLQEQLDTLLSGNASTAIESFNEIIAFLENVEDTETLDGIIAGINTTIANVQASVPTKLSQLTNDNDTVTDANYVHTDNNFTTEEKEKLASLGNGGDSNDYIVTIATSDKQLYKAGADTMDQATAETFLGPIDDLLAAIDAGKRIYIHNVEAKKLTELKAVYIGDFYSLLSIWADDSSSGSVINLTTSILSSKDVTNYGYRTGYTYARAGEILVGGGAQQDYSLSGDQTFTLVPDSFIPIRGCTTTMIISTLKDHSANITIEKHSSITDNMVVIGDNPFEIPANSAVEISVLYTNLANKGTYVVRYSEPFTRPS